jgi:biopolymer transport protein ExbD
MLRKKKNKHRLPAAELNIISLMDILTTLLFFILMVMTFTKLSILGGSSLKSGVASEEDKDKQVFSLKVTIEGEKKATIFLGPINKLKMVDQRNLYRFLNRKYKGSPTRGYRKTIWGKNSKQLFKRIQDATAGIKKGFPHENKVVVAIGDGVKYQTMIDAMAAMKQHREAQTLVNLLGQKEKSRILFPEIILAEK